ncbi:hypothetical protein CMV_007692 [Castanea mollissima]|uniref:Uncharacterized protein n=1 Tax=Castanea mollissima TaxID=60419 RepID=A0A8J4RMS3_9ROSI|nr:hypothetical protein CMV_007692 [Castanea mollissima]
MGLYKLSHKTDQSQLKFKPTFLPPASLCPAQPSPLSLSSRLMRSSVSHRKSRRISVIRHIDSPESLTSSNPECALSFC